MGKMRKKAEPPPADERTRVVERPDGFYWQGDDGQRERGPFPTLGEAEADLLANDDAALEPGESLAEAEDEIGIADWIDPDTGEPAEESVPRIEDH